MNKKSFLSLFKEPKPIIGMIHLKGIDHDDVCNRAIREINLMADHDFSGVLVENYLSEFIEDVEAVLAYLSRQDRDIIYGVNFFRE
ncbi:MAG: hypothetical protein ACOXZS_01815 [Bacilli bacterium]|jgi:predicted TIM-barrel enzyme